jgi:membrane associated rhomboid family serine protease
MSEPGPVSVRGVLFPKKGFSATELLLAANVTVAALLFALLGPNYAYALREWAGERWIDVHTHGAYGWFLPTLFLHAGPGHLTSNLLALIGAAGAVEFLMGGGWAIAIYFLTGIGAAWISYTGHGGPPLSIGASGAIMGLVGCTVSFIVRRRRLFNYALRWKVWRVYGPLFLLVFLPTLVHADVHAHTGGFDCGFVLGFFDPPHRRVALLAAEDSLRDEETEVIPAEEET